MRLIPRAGGRLPSLHKRIWKAVCDLLFPRRCPICDEPVKVGEGLACRACLATLSYISEPTCLRCGKGLPPSDAGREYCHDCAVRGHHFDRGMALFEYGCIAKAIFRFKYKGRREYAEFFGREMAAGMGREILGLRPDCLIPVPIHRRRRRARGYNQAAELARVLSRHLALPLDEKLIRRTRNTVPLKNLKYEERRNNLKKAFKITADDVKLKTVVIVDDIYTTGSTVDAMALELRQAGVGKVYFVALSIGKG